jgi:hypothetical protein
MATTTVLEAMCGCGHVRACHRAGLKWGEKSWEGCRHCACATFAAGSPPAADPGPEVISVDHAYACRACGSRYSRPYADHACGPLTPVTVTITVRAGAR